MMRAAFSVLLTLAVTSGCVVVNPSEVHVSASPGPVVVDVPRPTVGQTPYAHALHKVLHQQERLSKPLAERDWKEVADEAGDWISYTRELNGYAETTANPARFRRYCEQLLGQLTALRDAGLRHDAVACQQAIRACDPSLQQLSREFPTVIAPAVSVRPAVQTPVP